ncbi:hypothetical protein P3W45_001235 [Vairimorpha bombi]|jgi:V-type H+-transporting ATPase subunit H
MAVYLKTAENRLALDKQDSEIDRLIKEKNIVEILEKYSSIDHIRYILYKYPYLLSEECLYKLLKNKDKYISYKSFSLLTDIYKNVEHKKEYVVFFKYMLRENSTYEEKNQLLSLFVIFISCKSNNNFDLVERKDSIIFDTDLTNILKDMICVKELQYNILLILYVFSFTESYIPKICTYLKKIICILKDKSREKILRISYFVIVNILKSDYELSINNIYELRKITLNLCESNISDEYLSQNLKIAKDILNKKHSQYTIEKYTSDLFKGILEDHDFHYDEVFWTTGLPVIMKNSVEIIKILKKYLRSHNTEWICLACNDLYMLIKVHPEFYSLLTKHKVRDVLFELTKSENDEIRFKAIQALYACIFSEWN